MKWTFEAKKIAGNEYELHARAMIDADWHLYSQDAGDKLMSTVFNFAKNPIVKQNGKIREAGILKKFNDPTLHLKLNYYYNQVDFIQNIILKSNINVLIKGEVSYVVCNDKDDKCLPTKKIPFSIKIHAD